MNVENIYKDIKEKILIARSKMLKHIDTTLGLWEQMHNSEFKGIEFETFENEAGKNSFYLSPQKWISTTNAIGIISKSGNNGGTYAHSDIAFEFASWLSPEFKLYLIQELESLQNDINKNLLTDGKNEA